jgi:hypothetical protein
VTTPLPEGRERRGQLLLSGRLHPRDAHPLELAYATQHILSHPNLAANGFRRSREDESLAELRHSLGDWPRAYFGTATLLALAATPRAGDCVRCRANMIARVRRLPPPGFDAATNFLLGPGCDRCKRKPQAQSTKIRPSAVVSTSSRAAAPGRPTPGRVRDWLVNTAAHDPLLSNAVRKLLGDRRPAGIR